MSSFMRGKPSPTREGCNRECIRMLTPIGRRVDFSIAFSQPKAPRFFWASFGELALPTSWLLSLSSPRRTSRRCSRAARRP